jgi:hypothetical protein
MQRVNNRQEFEAFYHYAGYKPKVYPEKYPCLVKKVYRDGGLGADYYAHYVTYFPEKQFNNFEDAFTQGVESEWSYLC